MISRRIILVMLVVAAAVAGAVFVTFAPPHNDEEAPAAGNQNELVFERLKSESLQPDGFAGSNACRECHSKQFESWHDTYHRTMTQHATPESVVASFDNVTLSSRGQAIELSRDGDKFFATLGPLRKQVVLTTGSHLMQTYWVQMGDEYHQVPWFYHIEEEKWMPSSDSFLTPPTDSPASARWNDSCIKCHSTGPVPGYESGKGFETSFAELGISCEACHGAGQGHVDFYMTNSSLTVAPPADAVLVNPADCSNVAASQICGQCHSSSQSHDPQDWLKHGSRFRPGEDHTKYFRHAKKGSSNPKDAFYLKDSYWDDGTCRVGGDELLGMQDSRCYSSGEMSCLSCHSMHESDPTDQLKRFKTGNGACLQCHEELADSISEHTHHASEGSGSLCYNCHMPHTSFALFKAIRSHKVDSPAVDPKMSRPNACNLCHLDRGLQWTADHLSEWYGQPETVVSPVDSGRSAALNWLLKGDAVQRVVVAWAMAWPPALEASGSNWQAPFLAELLSDPYSAVRFVAWRSLKQLPGMEGVQFDFLAPLADLKAAVSQARAQWVSIEKKIAADRAARVLIRPDGGVDSKAVKEALQARDNRPIDIFE